MKKALFILLIIFFIGCNKEVIDVETEIEPLDLTTITKDVTYQTDRYYHLYFNFGAKFKVISGNPPTNIVYESESIGHVAIEFEEGDYFTLEYPTGAFLRVEEID